MGREYNGDSYAEEWFKLYKRSIQDSKAFYCNGIVPYKSFSPHVVEFIFNLANQCGMEETLKYKCVELYDRFLSEYFIRLHQKGYTKNPNNWPQVLEQCSQKSCLRIVSCIQLILKYTYKSLSPKLKDVEAILNRMGHAYSKKSIVSSEVKVLHIVGYKLNEPSIFTLVEYFIDIIPFNTTDRLYSTCLLVTDLFYIYHQELYNQLHYQVTEYRNYTHCEKLELLDIEYDKITTGAAVVITALFVLNPINQKNEELCRYLSTICEKPVDYLYKFSSILISIINSISIRLLYLERKHNECLVSILKIFGQPAEICFQLWPWIEVCILYSLFNVWLIHSIP